MSLITKLKPKIEKAAGEGRKVAAIHSLILIHSNDVAAYVAKSGPESLCSALGISGAYKTEIMKMLAASRYLESEGFKIA